MADVVAWWVGPRSGTAHTATEGRTAGSPGYGVFRTRDDRWIALGVLGELRLWAAICEALELDHLAALSFEERMARGDEVNAAVAQAVSRLDRDDALARLRGPWRAGDAGARARGDHPAPADPGPGLPRGERRGPRRRASGPARGRRSRARDPRPRAGRAPRGLRGAVSPAAPQAGEAAGAWDTLWYASSRTRRISASCSTRFSSRFASPKPV